MSLLTFLGLLLETHARPFTDLNFLAKCSADEFDKFVTPFLGMSVILYYDTHDMNDTEKYTTYTSALNAHGWIQDHSLTADPADLIGVKANVFHNDDRKMTVVAYRGTNFKNLADVCADKFLWGPEGLEEYDCSKFTPEQVNYYAQAMAFMKKVEAKTPNHYEIAVTGHSLGAGIGALVGITTNYSTVVYSSPAYGPFAEKNGLDWKHADPSKLFILADQWDPNYNGGSNMPPGEMHPTIVSGRSGTACVWKSNITTACYDDYFKHEKSAVKTCFAEKHNPRNYADLIGWFNHLSAGAVRPVCSVLSI